MIYVLLVLLIALGVGAFILFDKNILSPSVMACGVFFISTSVAALNSRAWNFVMAPITVVVIATALTAFCAGEFAARRIYALFAKKKQPPSLTLPDKPIIVPWQITLVLCVLIAGMLAYFYTETVNYAMRYGYEKGNANLLSIVYSANVKAAELGVSNLGYIAKQCKEIAKDIACICTFIFLYNFIFFKNLMKNLLFLIPVILYIPYIILSGGRIDFIFMVSVWIVLAGIFTYQKSKTRTIATLKITVTGISGFFLLLLLFSLAGFYRGWLGNFKTVTNYVFLYVGASIPALNDYLVYPRPSNAYFGRETLSSIYHFLSILGLDVPPLYTGYKHLESTVNLGNIHTNVYTAIRRYIQDYGFSAMYFILFAWGILFALAFLKTRKTKNYPSLLYACSIYPVVMISIDEQFIVFFFSLSFVYRLICMGILYYVLIDREIIHLITKYIKKTNLRKTSQ